MNACYYPFGLTMAGISSKALAFGSPENKIKFQGQEFATREFSDGSGLEMYEFKYRMDDPQIGRFWQQDPLAHKFIYNSIYAFSENKVISHVELEGLEAVDAYLITYYNKDGSEDFEYFERKIYPSDARPQFGTKGTLYHVTNFYEYSNRFEQFDIYEPDCQNDIKQLNSIFPQAIIFANGHGDFDVGSPINHDKPVLSFYLSENGEFGVFDLISLLGKIPSEYGSTKDISKYMIENFPGLFNRYTERFKPGIDPDKKSPDTVLGWPFYPVSEYWPKPKSGDLYTRVDGYGNTINTIYFYPWKAPEFNKKAGDSIIFPNIFDYPGSAGPMKSQGIIK